MTILGLDIGTTTISAVIVKNGIPDAFRTIKNDSFLPGRPTWEKTQDPNRILSIVTSVTEELLTEYPDVACIGITGQQHGIVYLDKSGHCVSPLYTWQDERGNLPFNDTCSYAAYLSEQTGQALASGFGTVTHFYNLKNHLVPEDAAVFCTIQDYTAMFLTGRTVPFIHASDAASFGLFDIQKNNFSVEAIHRSGMDFALFPMLSKNPCLGIGKYGIPVFTAIGDNQASFLGATAGQQDCMLINIGTGSQISIYSRIFTTCDLLETRPFTDGNYILAGSALCGGRAYALLESFFRMTAEMATGRSLESCYEAMSHMLNSSPMPSDLPIVNPLFEGTRKDPSLRASITQLNTKNLTPLHLTYGIMYGMINELYAMYENYCKTNSGYSTLFGSGNGLRQNPHLCKIVEEIFGMPLKLSLYKEEAAYGAALFAEQCMSSDNK